MNFMYRYPVHDMLNNAAQTEFIIKGRNSSEGFFSKGCTNKWKITIAIPDNLIIWVHTPEMRPIISEIVGILLRLIRSSNFSWVFVLFYFYNWSQMQIQSKQQTRAKIFSPGRMSKGTKLTILTKVAVVTYFLFPWKTNSNAM